VEKYYSAGGSTRQLVNQKSFKKLNKIKREMFVAALVTEGWHFVSYAYDSFRPGRLLMIIGLLFVLLLPPSASLPFELDRKRERERRLGNQDKK
jgi:hypothetical protein